MRTPGCAEKLLHEMAVLVVLILSLVILEGLDYACTSATFLDTLIANSIPDAKTVKLLNPGIEGMIWFRDPRFLAILSVLHSSMNRLCINAAPRKAVRFKDKGDTWTSMEMRSHLQQDMPATQEFELATGNDREL